MTATPAALSASLDDLLAGWRQQRDLLLRLLRHGPDPHWSGMLAHCEAQIRDLEQTLSMSSSSLT